MVAKAKAGALDWFRDPTERTQTEKKWEPKPGPSLLDLKF
jgi:hypothetical protein